MVRLAPPRAIALITAIAHNFNPTLVRLAPPGATLTPWTVNTFQSHLGSISTSSSAHAARNCLSADFNPTLVRLAPRATRLFVIATYDFNPTLVRLALPSAKRLKYGGSLFQSHLGSISTANGCWEQMNAGSFQSHLGSISTVVAAANPPDQAAFQSHLGSISTPVPEVAVVVDTYFNPTLVRLAPMIRPHASNPSPSFQSHLGSISTKKGNKNPRMICLVSIPPWFD